ncbi:hypothetical protein I317_00308 [Kwoniella heveanensis CBS 569]|nr:hypothetical protein I317_00308 [Kwoniella heveanensis CBS 569]
MTTRDTDANERRRHRQARANVLFQSAGDFLNAAAQSRNAENFSAPSLSMPARTKVGSNGNYCASEGTRVVYGRVFHATLNGEPVVAVRQHRSLGGTVGYDNVEGLKVYDASVGGDGSITVPGVPLRSLVQHSSTRPRGILLPVPSSIADPSIPAHQDPRFDTASYTNAALSELASSDAYGLQGAKLKGIILGKVDHHIRCKPYNDEFRAESMFEADSVLCFEPTQGTQLGPSEGDVLETMFRSNHQVTPHASQLPSRASASARIRAGDTDDAASDISTVVDTGSAWDDNDSVATEHTLVGRSSSVQITCPEYMVIT